MPNVNRSVNAIFSKEETRFGGSYSSVTIQQMDYVFCCEGPTLNLSTSQSCGFLMKLFNSANIDTITNCRWYLDFQLPSEVLVKKSAKFERKFADCKNLHRYFGISE